ncbi:hypothetical protein F7725_023712 [Dissostichus mawsoni]|uniref:cardiolipin synthase (CMP-forming) n=1 Tax=Dissostichus mawsoni TaxID=36200 RepID=A0A7J5XY14_DISMA|nr:hypothetical protein F7725_023712 [Dissostichus mawsoni]
MCRNVAHVRWLVCARRAYACGLEPASWRHTPVTGRLKPFPVSCLWPLGVYDTGILQQVNNTTPWHVQGKRLVHWGGHGRSVGSFRSRALQREDRGDTGPKGGGEPGEAGLVPGDGLFKFKELLDGYIARTWPSQKSALGSALDPLADKILVSFLYVTLSKFFNPCYTTAQLKPTLFSKVNTAIQLLLVASSLAAPVFQYTDSVLLQSLWYITAVTTAASGYSYWHYGRKTVKVLNTRSL